ncbi:MAG: type II toxin-antitoxin system RelE family toxin [Myxococcota bacterium]
MRRLEIRVSATAERQLRAAPRADQERLIEAMRALATNPRPRGCRKLQGYDDTFRIRVGVYRIIYAVQDRQLLVIVLKIGHRRDAYR